MGTSVAFILVAKYVYMPLIKNNEQENERMPFEWQYIDELDNLAVRLLSTEELVKLADKEVDVETPAGRVLMSYDEDSKSFVYYTNKKSIPFKYLDAVARQFAVENDAKQICVNYGYDYVASEQKLQPACNERSSVFVSFKPLPSQSIRSKITNRFSHRGTIEQKWTVLEKPNPITFADYKKKYVDIS